MSTIEPTTVTSTATVGLPSYIVLHKDESGCWRVVKEVEARSSRDAIKDTVGKAKSSAAGMFVAVPVSSWKPVTVRTETQTVVKLEDA